MAENSVEPSTPRANRGGSRRPAVFEQERTVRRYLSDVEGGRAGRSAKRTADAVGNRITKVDELLVSADPLSRVHLTQERIELHAEYVRLTNGHQQERSQLERDFLRVVRSYGDRHGITYAAWRQVGVEAAVLEKAGIRKAEKKPPPAAARAAQEEERGGPSPDSSPPGAPAEATPKDTDRETPTGTAREAPKAKEAPKAEAAAVPVPEGGGFDDPTEAVSLDELAALLADASVSSTPGSTQPRLSEDVPASNDEGTTGA